MKKIFFSILFLFSLVSFIHITYAEDFTLKCERGQLVKENNFKPIVWNFFKEKEHLYVYDLVKTENGEFKKNQNRKYVVRTNRKNHLDWVKVRKDNIGYVLIYHSYFIDKNYMALYWTGMTQDDFDKINETKLLLDNKKIDPLRFFKVKEDVLTKYWEFVSKNDQITALDTCSINKY